MACVFIYMEKSQQQSNRTEVVQLPQVEEPRQHLHRQARVPQEPLAIQVRVLPIQLRLTAHYTQYYDKHTFI